MDAGMAFTVRGRVGCFAGDRLEEVDMTESATNAIEALAHKEQQDG